jgi:hypothetical protein
MTKREMIHVQRHMVAENGTTFDRWLKANMVVGSIFSAGLLAMAVAGSDPGPRQALADVQATDLSAASTAGQASQISPYALTIRFAPGDLPVQQVNEPF